MGQFQDLRIPAILLSLTVLGCSGPGTDPVTVTDVTTTDASEVLDGMGDGETDGMVAEDVTAPWLPLDDCAPACAALAEELGGCWQVGCESPEGECMSAMRAEETPCGTEDACHTPGACVEGTCEGAVATDCDDDNLCTEEQCDPELGCVYTSLLNCFLFECGDRL